MKRTLIIALLLLLVFPATALGSPIMLQIDVKSTFAPTGYWKNTIVSNDSPYNETRFTVDPVIDSGRTLVPLRQVATALGYEVLWDAPNQKITLKGHNLKGDTSTVIMKIGNTQATIDGQPRTLDVPPKIIYNSTMIPIRFVSEAMGYYVKYENGVISITDYELLKASDLPNYESDKNWSYYSGSEQHLAKDGVTPRGIKVGDSIADVLKAYPRGLEYSSTFSDVLYYDTCIPYNNAKTWGLAFKFKDGKVIDIYGTHQKPVNAK